MTLDPLNPRPRQGSERFRNGPQDLGFDVQSFWRWIASDLVGNTMRGLLAEYVVARAVGARATLREEWAAYDLVTPDGVRVEVKSSAFVQNWRQGSLTRIKFGIARRHAWDSSTGLWGTEVKRHADVFVFAILAHEHKATIDPLDLGQWQFHVLPTRVLDSACGDQKTIGLSRLRGLAGQPVLYDRLAESVRQAGASARDVPAEAPDGAGPRDPRSDRPRRAE